MLLLVLVDNVDCITDDRVLKKDRRSVGEREDGVGSDPADLFVTLLGI